MYVHGQDLPNEVTGPDRGECEGVRGPSLLLRPGRGEDGTFLPVRSGEMEPCGGRLIGPDGGPAGGPGREEGVLQTPAPGGGVSRDLR